MSRMWLPLLNINIAQDARIPGHVFGEARSELISPCRPAGVTHL